MSLLHFNPGVQVKSCIHYREIKLHELLVWSSWAWLEDRRPCCLGLMGLDLGTRGPAGSLQEGVYLLGLALQSPLL